MNCCPIACHAAAKKAKAPKVYSAPGFKAGSPMSWYIAKGTKIVVTRSCK